MTEFHFALEAYAAMINTCDTSRLELWLADDFSYFTQLGWSNFTSKSAYLEYMSSLLQPAQRPEGRIWAEMGWLDEDDFPGGPCVVLAQGDKDNLFAVALADIDGMMIRRLTLCNVPSPLSAHRTGIYPE